MFFIFGLNDEALNRSSVSDQNKDIKTYKHEIVWEH